MAVLSLAKCRESMARNVEQAILDASVLECLCNEEGWIPKECELWDYKECLPSNKTESARVVRHVVAFHNAHGGYIVFGVAEIEDNAVFRAAGLPPEPFNLEQFRQVLANYTGEQIDVSYRCVQHTRSADNLLVGLLHIPKRPAGRAPVKFIRDGPDQDDGAKIFRKEDVYLRKLDTSVPAKTREDWGFLASPRQNDLLPSSDSLDLLENNLPERAFICGRFVGRESILEQLWRWLGDPFSRVRLLAGDGGKGKTSIAYEFARDICHRHPGGLQAVIWLTAKRKQFIGSLNHFVNVPETHFQDMPTLLQRLALELAAKEDEIDGVSDDHLRKLIHDSLETLPCFIVLDDIDSLEPEEQRKVLELAIQVVPRTSNILLTSRMNMGCSPDLCITVPGLPEDDFRIYVDTLEQRLAVPSLKKSEVERLWKVSDGSPLFAESILRLVKTGQPVDQAISAWRNHAGEEVRSAALMREIRQLDLDGRRVLFVVSLLNTASVSELRQICGLDERQIQSCIHQLQMLFLISAPRFTEAEPRFEVSSNTAALIIGAKNELVDRAAHLEDKVRRVFRDAGTLRTGKRGRDRGVGAVVRQVIAHLRDHRYEDALATVDAALTTMPNQRDLMVVRGRCLFAQSSHSGLWAACDEARTWFRRAYEAGSRREELYEFWYKCELKMKSPASAAEVAGRAVADGIEPKYDWLERQGEASFALARLQVERLDYRGAVVDFRDACARFCDALRDAPPNLRPQIAESLFQVTEEAWVTMARSADRPNDVIDAYAFLAGVFKRGLARVEVLVMMTEAVAMLLGMYRRSDGVNSERVRSLADRADDIQSCLSSIRNIVPANRAEQLDKRVSDLRFSLSAAT